MVVMGLVRGLDRCAVPAPAWPRGIGRAPDDAVNSAIAVRHAGPRAGLGEIHSFCDAYLAEEKRIAGFCRRDDPQPRLPRAHRRACRNVHIQRFAQPMRDPAPQVRGCVCSIVTFHRGPQFNL
ncbi:hypothetical protein [Bordetella ansorpii]|uniref:hypothetical protein n=1 Tax=Bordetella ansorpii TaxID=288768 RepID=UPI0008241534|nr:hypothetical protein [Bordetella ansorpii]